MTITVTRIIQLDNKLDEKHASIDVGEQEMTGTMVEKTVRALFEGMNPPLVAITPTEHYQALTKND